MDNNFRTILLFILFSILVLLFANGMIYEIGICVTTGMVFGCPIFGAVLGRSQVNGLNGKGKIMLWIFSVILLTEIIISFLLIC